MAQVTSKKLANSKVPDAGTLGDRTISRKITTSAGLGSDGDFIEAFILKAPVTISGAAMDVSASAGTLCALALWANTTQLTSDSAAAAADEVNMVDFLKVPQFFSTDVTVQIEVEGAAINSIADVTVWVTYNQSDPRGSI